MSNVEQSKICAACAEAIKPSAKICPYCRTKQVRFALWRQDLGGAVASLVLIGLFIAGIAWMDPDQTLKGRCFESHRTDLKVGHVTLETGKPKGFRVMGVVTNRGNGAWRVESIEVRFRGQDGSLIDVQHSELDSPFVIQPGGEGAFGLSFWRLNPNVVTARIEARVQNATDGDRPPKAD